MFNSKEWLQVCYANSTMQLLKGAILQIVVT